MPTGVSDLMATLSSAKTCPPNWSFSLADSFFPLADSSFPFAMVLTSVRRNHQACRTLYAKTMMHRPVRLPVFVGL
jgi:hypothetical protein